MCRKTMSFASTCAAYSNALQIMEANLMNNDQPAI